MASLMAHQLLIGIWSCLDRLTSARCPCADGQPHGGYNRLLPHLHLHLLLANACHDWVRPCCALMNLRARASDRESDLQATLKAACASDPGPLQPVQSPLSVCPCLQNLQHLRPGWLRRPEGKIPGLCSAIRAWCSARSCGGSADDRNEKASKKPGNQAL